MDIQLLTTEDNVKLIGGLDENIAGKYLRHAIMEAQEVGLRNIIGTNLLEALKTAAGASTLADEYKTLVDEYIVYYLAYAAKAELLPKVAYKVSNAGVVKGAAEGYTAATPAEMESEIARAQAKADYHAYRMQLWLKANAAALPELTQRDCDRINACLRSSADCGIWLGGARGSDYRESACECDDESRWRY